MIGLSITRTTLPPFRLQLYASKAFLTAACHHNRQLSTSLLCRNSLSTKQSHQEATASHKRGYFYQLLACLIHLVTPEELPASSSSPLTKHDAVSTIPDMVRGDWVLFHPVYQPAELKAVEVYLLLPNPISGSYLFPW